MNNQIESLEKEISNIKGAISALMLVMSTQLEFMKLSKHDEFISKVDKYRDDMLKKIELYKDYDSDSLIARCAKIVNNDKIVIDSFITTLLMFRVDFLGREYSYFFDKKPNDDRAETTENV